jgi:Tol biopolymer transport system component
VKSVSGDGSEQPLLELPSEAALITNDWSPDGRFLMYQARDAQTSRDLWVLPLEGDRKPRVFLKTKFDEAVGQFSPDGRWVAYQSNESGRYEIYVRRFVDPLAIKNSTAGSGGQWLISTAGGLGPRWRTDSKELYYVDPTARMMAAPIAATGDTLHVGVPVVLFQTRIVGGGVQNAAGRYYDVTRDGRFLINTILEDTSTSITLIQNWNPIMK